MIKSKALFPIVLLVLFVLSSAVSLQASDYFYTEKRIKDLNKLINV